MTKKLILIILSFIFIIPIFVEAKPSYLYDVLKNEAESNGLARKYTDEHHDSFTADPSKNIYYWYATNNIEGTEILNKNNVIFANHCWQMMRTTDTGGVKMIYNGEAVNNQCLSTRENHVGYAERISKNLASNYWYGTDYTYDSINKTFKVSGTTEQATWSEKTGPSLIGKYTCKSTSVDDTCSTLYLVELPYDTTSAYVIQINSNSHYSQFGVVQFSRYLSLSDIGYMYNTRYPRSSKTMTSNETMLSSSSLSTNYWYAHDAVWSSQAADKYNLDSPYQISTTTDYPNLVGEYTFRNTTQNYTNTNLYYIAAVDDSTMYYILLDNSGSHTLADFNHTYTYGDSYTDNGDGTYTINNPITIKRSDWYTNYNNIGANKYVCKNAVNDTCSELWYTTSTSNTSMTYIKVANSYKYAKDFEYKQDPDDGVYKYFLKNDTSVNFWNINDSTNKTSLNNAHYTCWNTTGKCTKISYIYYIGGITPQYINLEDGKNAEDARNEMLYNNEVNKTNSTVKSGIDAWYKHYMLDYDNYIEDTIFCSDRSILSLGGWNPNGGNIEENLKFSEVSLTKNLNCANVVDQFSTSNPSARLTYKVGLMSSPEANILSNANIRKTGNLYWLSSPYFFGGNGAASRAIDFTGIMSGSILDGKFGVRPAISLIPDIEYASGNGSMENPYIIKEIIKNDIIINNDNTKGTVSNLDNTTDIDYLSDVTFTITPKKGYYVKKLDIKDSNHETINYEVNGNNYTFQMPDSDVTIMPIYEKIKSSINIQVVAETEDLNIEINDLTKV